MSHGTGIGNYIRAGTKSPIAPVGNGDYTFIDGDAGMPGNYELENGYDDRAEFQPETRRKKRRSSDSDDEDDSDDDDSEDSDFEGDSDSDGYSGGGVVNTLNGWSGVISMLCLLILIAIAWFIYEIRKDISSMFGE